MQSDPELGMFHADLKYREALLGTETKEQKDFLWLIYRELMKQNPSRDSMPCAYGIDRYAFDSKTVKVRTIGGGESTELKLPKLFLKIVRAYESARGIDRDIRSEKKRKETGESKQTETPGINAPGAAPGVVPGTTGNQPQKAG